MLEHFLTYLTHHCRVEPGDSGIVGVSGGADSTALVLLLEAAATRLGLHLTVVAVDHGLRPGSRGEAAAVGDLCAALRLPFRLVAVDVRRRAADDRRCLEEAARLERHEALERERRRAGAAWIALGHTRADQAETALQRLRRGAGLDGLASMAARRDRIIRPLLWAGRDEVRQYLRERGVGWAEDPTNADSRFERSRLRAELLPRIDERVVVELASEAATVRARLGEGEAAWIERHVRILPGAVVIDAAALRGLPEPIAARLVRRAAQLAAPGEPQPLGRRATAALVELGLGRGGRELDLPGLTARRVGGAGGASERLVIGAPVEPPPLEVVRVTGPGTYRLASLRVTAVVGTERPRSPIWGVVQGEGPFEIRRRMPGDRLAPDRKKVKRVLQKVGVGPHLRDWVPIVVRTSMVVWTAVEPWREGPGTLVSFQLDRSHPLRGWAGAERPLVRRDDPFSRLTARFGCP